MVVAVGPVSGPAKLTVNGDATNSFDPDGAIILYEWDFNYDGYSFHPQATGAQTTTTYGWEGQYTIACRITDNDGLTSTATHTVSVWVDPLGIPWNVTASPVATGVKVAWTRPIIGYGYLANVYSLRVPETQYSLINSSPIYYYTDFIDTTAQLGNLYFYAVTVLAWDSDAGAYVESGYSNSASILYNGLTVPEAPYDLYASNRISSAGLTWSVPADGGSPITQYNVYRGTVSGSLIQIGIHGQAGYNDADVTAGVMYYYAVSAVNAMGEGPRSAEVSITLETAGPPRQPTGLAVDAIDHGLRLTWQASPDAGEGDFAGYRVYYTVESGSRTGPILVNSGTAGILDGLVNGMGYTIEVTSRNTGGLESAPVVVHSMPFKLTTVVELDTTGNPETPDDIYTDAGWVYKVRQAQVTWRPLLAGMLNQQMTVNSLLMWTYTCEVQGATLDIMTSTVLEAGINTIGVTIHGNDASVRSGQHDFGVPYLEGALYYEQDIGPFGPPWDDFPGKVAITQAYNGRISIVRCTDGAVYAWINTADAIFGTETPVPVSFTAGKLVMENAGCAVIVDFINGTVSRAEGTIMTTDTLSNNPGLINKE